MLDPARLSVAAGAASSTRTTLRMLADNDRMAGTEPVWGRFADTPAPAGAGDAVPADALPYAQTDMAATDDRPFSFYDLLDIVNPLQHIPIVSTLYRNITGDEISPASRIVGGALFGGAVGAAGSLVNVIVQEETGRDIAENVVAMVQTGERPQWHGPAHSIDSDPEQALDRAWQLAQADTAPGDEDSARAALPPQVLAFADTGAAWRPAHIPRPHEIAGRYND
jgi:hypothetical protein